MFMHVHGSSSNMLDINLIILMSSRKGGMGMQKSKENCPEKVVRGDFSLLWEI